VVCSVDWVSSSRCARHDKITDISSESTCSNLERITLTVVSKVFTRCSNLWN